MIRLLLSTENETERYGAIRETGRMLEAWQVRQGEVKRREEREGREKKMEGRKEPRERINIRD